MPGKKNLPPIKVGQILEVDIITKGEKGDGIAKVEGFTIIVPEVDIQENLKIKITRVEQSYGFGKVV